MGVKAGIVGFSFGLRIESEEPNVSNHALAVAIVQACGFVDFYDWEPIVVTQWEITKALKMRYRKVPIEHSVGLRPDGEYLDSKIVWSEAKEVFERSGITSVVVVAQPFLHLPSLKQMIRDDGFEVLDFKMPDIPFDNSPRNTQPWTRTKPQLLAYAIRVKLGLSHGHNGRQSAA